MALLSVQNVSKTFKDHDYRVHAVRNASLEVHRGEMIAIIGPSGSGKTTLLNLMGIVVAPDSGEVYVDGQKASDMSDAVRCRIRNQYFGYIVAGLRPDRGGYLHAEYSCSNALQQA